MKPSTKSVHGLLPRTRSLLEQDLSTIELLSPSASTVNSLGVEAFFKRLFKSLGIPLTQNVSYYLELKERNHNNKRLAKVKTHEAKIKKRTRENITSLPTM
jgi:hypothetical protein